MEKGEHLYIHVPFCQQICHYCNFHKHLASGYNQLEFIKEGILKEIKLHQEAGILDKKIKSIYLGGGTPSLLSIKTLEILLKGLQNLFLIKDTEFTIEADPLTFGKTKAKILIDHGINRISFGAQSFSDETLKKLGRTHRRKHIFESVDILRKIGFDNISIDLILGTPEENKENRLNSFENCISLKPEHISVYILTYEQDTYFFKKYLSRKLSEDKERILYDMMVNYLTNHCYYQYEVSNFAKNSHGNKNYESSHNKAYWFKKNYIGIGPSASSALINKRWKNIPDTKKYLENLKINKPHIQDYEILSPQSIFIEELSIQLRTKWGIDLAKLSHKKDKIDELVKLDLVEIVNDKLRIKPNKFALSDGIIESLL